MDDALAHETLKGVLELIDQWGDVYDRRWGRKADYQEHPELPSQVDAVIDKVRARTRLAHDVIDAMGEKQLATKGRRTRRGGVYGTSVHPGPPGDCRSNRDFGSARGAGRDYRPGPPVAQRHTQIHLPRRHGMADALCRGDFSGDRIPVVTRPVRAVGGAVGAAGHQLGDGRQPPRRRSRLHPGALSDRGHHRRVIGAPERVGFGQQADTGDSEKPQLWMNRQLWITKPSTRQRRVLEPGMHPGNEPADVSGPGAAPASRRARRL
jgi:hypothetical protein